MKKKKPFLVIYSAFFLIFSTTSLSGSEKIRKKFSKKIQPVNTTHQTSESPETIRAWTKEQVVQHFFLPFEDPSHPHFNTSFSSPEKPYSPEKKKSLEELQKQKLFDINANGSNHSLRSAISNNVYVEESSPEENDNSEENDSKEEKNNDDEVIYVDFFGQDSTGIAPTRRRSSALEKLGIMSPARKQKMSSLLETIASEEEEDYDDMQESNGSFQPRGIFNPCYSALSPARKSMAWEIATITNDGYAICRPKRTSHNNSAGPNLENIYENPFENVVNLSTDSISEHIYETIVQTYPQQNPLDEESQENNFLDISTNSLPSNEAWNNSSDYDNSLTLNDSLEWDDIQNQSVHSTPFNSVDTALKLDISTDSLPSTEVWNDSFEYNSLEWDDIHNQDIYDLLLKSTDTSLKNETQNALNSEIKNSLELTKQWNNTFEEYEQSKRLYEQELQQTYLEDTLP